MTSGHDLTRRGFLSGAAALMAGAAGATALPDAGLGYLETLVVRSGTPFVPPSALHPAYSHAVYVNASQSGPAMQRMWVLARDTAGRWGLAAHDAAHWQTRPGISPDYSWPVSTGRKYPGDARSGPTPLGVFNIDDRRYRPGWGAPGMFNALYIDLHYSGGRASGVAIHGTTQAQYRKLGRVDSHGCVRMHQANADRVWQIVHPGGRRRAESPLWGEIPRYFTSDPGSDKSVRRGYVRDGALLRDGQGQLLTRQGYRMVLVFFRDDP